MSILKIKEVDMPHTKAKNEQEAGASRHEEPNTPDQMCCDGKRTAAEHRKESPDGKCCSDS